MEVTKTLCRNLDRIETPPPKLAAWKEESNCFRNICHDHECSQPFFSSRIRVKINISSVRKEATFIDTVQEFLEQCKTPTVQGPAGAQGTFVK